MNNYKHIIFDLDDTILDFQDSEEKALKQIITQFKLPYNEQTIACYKRINNGLWHQLEEGLISRDEVLTTRFSLFLEDRITSYNVCYTKLLRAGTGAITKYIQTAANADTRVLLFEKDPALYRELRFQYAQYGCYRDACRLP